MNNMSDRELMETEERDKMQKNSEVKGKFSDYDRIFCLKDDRENEEAVLLFSTDQQSFSYLDLKSKQFSMLELNTEKVYQQVELYDEKLFCVTGSPLTLDVFFSSKKKRFYHKSTIYFSNKELRLAKQFGLLVWKHQGARVVYRCLLGPLESGRYLNFDLPERYFESKTDQEQTIGRMFYVSLQPDEEGAALSDVICTLDEMTKSIVCVDRKTQLFFEYNDFSEKDSKYLNVIRRGSGQYKLKKMYFYYPYDFFTDKEKNQLQANAREAGEKTDLDRYVRNRYREILLCMENGVLLKMNLVGDMPLTKMNTAWEYSKINGEEINDIIDLAVNGRTGEIYCLCGRGIRILNGSGRKANVLQNQKPREFFTMDNYTS